MIASDRRDTGALLFTPLFVGEIGWTKFKDPADLMYIYVYNPCGLRC